MEINHEVVKELINYDPDTGVFTWRKRDVSYFDNSNGQARRICNSWNAVNAGQEISSINHGRMSIAFFKRVRYGAARVAWLYITSEWPKHYIDHIDGDPLNNRFSNLREATVSQNGCNRGRQSNNSSGYKGVIYDKSINMYRAKIAINGKQIYLGCSHDPEVAHSFYKSAAEKYHGEFARSA